MKRYSADQLISASASSVFSVVQNYSYSYDLAGNRLSEQIQSADTASDQNLQDDMKPTGGGKPANLSAYETY